MEQGGGLVPIDIDPEAGRVVGVAEGEVVGYLHLGVGEFMDVHEQRQSGAVIYPEELKGKGLGRHLLLEMLWRAQVLGHRHSRKTCRRS
jgi:predicted GNAT family N-acyltransferase